MPHNEPKWPHPGSWPDSGPVEGAGPVRQFAAQTWAIYSEFKKVGFSDDQAYGLLMMAVSYSQVHHE